MASLFTYVCAQALSFGPIHSMRQLPTELILKILCKSDPQDVIRWRTVSRLFYAITCDDLLWKTLYTNSPFPRPPGPSPSQSRPSLERMLIKSGRLAQSWTTRPMREVSSVMITVGEPLAVTPNKLISGRWLVGCEEARRFILHDADPRAKIHPHKVLWEQDEPIVLAWDVHSVAPVGGQPVIDVYVLLVLYTMEPQWKLLKFRLDDESGEIYDSATINPPTWVSSTLSSVELHGGKSRFLSISTDDPQCVVFDTQTRVFYALAPLWVALEDTFPGGSHLFNPLSLELKFTDAHIISLYRHFSWDHAFVNLVQIFVIPCDESLFQDGKPILRLTHEGFSESRLLNVVPIKSFVDSITGDTTLRLLSLDGYLKIKSIDLMLPKTSDLEVARMTIHDGPVIPAQIEEVYSEYSQCVDVCDDTQSRGFCTVRPEEDVMKSIENQHIIKFTTKMSQDLCSVTYSQMAPVKWSDAEDSEDVTASSIVFDGLRGKLCYVHPEVPDQIVVVEIE